MEGLNGEVMDEIKRIEREEKFSEGIALPGYHEVVARLTDFERAICIYMNNVLNSVNASNGQDSTSQTRKSLAFFILFINLVVF